MSVNDPILLKWDKKHEFWYLTRGQETFYDEKRYMRVWLFEDDAIIWSKENLGKTPTKEMKQGKLI